MTQALTNEPKAPSCSMVREARDPNRSRRDLGALRHRENRHGTLRTNGTEAAATKAPRAVQVLNRVTPITGKIKKRILTDRRFGPMVFGMSYDKYRMHLPTVLRKASEDPVTATKEYMRQCFREHGYHARASIPCGYVMSALCAYFGDDYDAASAALVADRVVIREEDHFLLSPQERLRLLETERLIEHWMEHDYSAPSFYPTCQRDGVMAQLRAELAEIGGAP